MPERWTRAIVRSRRVVVAVWIVAVAVGWVAWVDLPGRLTASFDVPGSDSARAGASLARDFGERPEGTFLVLFRVHSSADRALRRRLDRRLGRAARAVPGGQARPLRPGGGVFAGEVATRLGLQDAARATPALRAALRGPGPPALVTGQPAFQHDLDPVLAHDLRRGELVAIPLALLILVLLLGASPVVLVPFAVAGAAIGTTAVALDLVARGTEVSTYTRNLVGLIGLGLAIDYSLLVVSRFREELARSPAEDAAVRTLATAGRAVAVSGAAVALGLALLLVVPVPFVRSLGFAGLLVVAASVLAAVTLLPALLVLLGGRVGRSRPARDARWGRLAAAVQRRPRTVLAAGVLLLLGLAAPALGLRLVPGSFAGVPHATEAARGLAIARRDVGRGAVTPIHVVVDGGAPGAARSAAIRRAVRRLADSLAHDPEVLFVASGTEPPFVAGNGRSARIAVVARDDYGALRTQALVRRLRGRLVAAARFPASARVSVGGTPAQGVDFLDAAYGAFPWLVAAVLAVSFGVLALAFRSLLVPLKAVVLNALTVAAAYGGLVVVFQHGSVAAGLGLTRTDEVEGWVPILLFAIVFGLSMDYEVFIVSRIREAWERGADDDAAVRFGLERTGAVVTAAAAIMAVAFAGFLAGSVAGLQQLGFGLALAVLLDATLVRMLLVPAVMTLAGRWNWWLPGQSGGGGARSGRLRRSRAT